MKNLEWYHKLNQPEITIKDWLFLPVWIFLYITMFLSIIILLLTNSNYSKNIPIASFVIQLILNLSWSPVFFGLKNIGAGLVINVLLWISIIVVMISFYPISKFASLILIPYFLWATFALYLNSRIFILNRNNDNNI